MQFKISTLGEGAVGKTAIIVRYTKGFFKDEYDMTTYLKDQATLGVSFATKDLKVDGDAFKLNIWDMMAQEHLQLRLLRPSYYKGSVGAVVIFDLTRKGTFDALLKWINDFRSFDKNVPIIIVGNKLDLEDLREVNAEEAIDFVNKNQCYGYIESSAKTGENINKLFEVITRIICKYHANSLFEEEKIEKSKERKKFLNELGKQFDKYTLPLTLPYIKLGKKKKSQKQILIEQEKQYVKEEIELEPAEIKSLTNLFLKEEIDIINHKVEEILTEPPKEGEFRFLIFGNENSQKPLLRKLLRVEKIKWPPKVPSILYNTLKYTMKIDQKYDFQLYFLSNLNKLKEKSRIFNKACELSDGVVIFYDPTNPKDIIHATDMGKTLRDYDNELEIILTSGFDIPPDLFYELKKLEKEYEIHNSDDYNSLISELLINTINKKRGIQKEIKFAKNKLKEIQEQLYDQKVRKDFMELIQSMGSKKTVSFDFIKNLIFISYSHKDLEWLERVQVHLKPLEREGAISRWDDTLIKAGEDWREKISQSLNSSKVAILLITPNFLASDFIANNELPPLLELARKRGTTILSLIIKPSRFDKIKSLSQLQTINDPSKPLVNLSEGEQDEILVRLSNAVDDAFKN